MIIEYKQFYYLNLYFLKGNSENMTIVVNKKGLNNLKKLLSEKVKKSSVNGNLSKHFGQLKRDIDGLEYQLLIRENED